MHIPISKNTVIAWIIGSIFGLLVSLLLFDNISERGTKNSSHAHSHEDLLYEEGPDGIPEFHNESVHKGEDLVAKKLAESVRVLCWIMTQPKNHKSKVQNKVLSMQILIKRLHKVDESHGVILS